MKVTKIVCCVLVVLFIGSIVMYAATKNDNWLVVLGLSVCTVPALPFVALADYAGYRKKHPEKYAAKEAARKAREDELWQKRQEMKYAKSIVEVKLLGGGSVKQKRAGAGGFALGGLLFGLPGAIAGAVIPDGTEQRQRFAVKYGDGQVEVKELHPNSWEYKELMKHVKWEDLK